MFEFGEHQNLPPRASCRLALSWIASTEELNAPRAVRNLEKSGAPRSPLKAGINVWSAPD
jgi:hypothetical protein